MPTLDVIEEWYECAEDLKLIKAKAMILRRQICDELLDGVPLNKSGNAISRQLISGYKLKASHGLSYSIDEGVLTSIWEAISESEKESFKFKPSLVKAKYLAVDEGSLVHEAITSKLGAPTLKVEQ